MNKAGKGASPTGNFVPKLYQATKSTSVPVYYLDSEDTLTNEELQTFRDTYGIKLVPNLSKFHAESQTEIMQINDQTSSKEIKEFLLSKIP